MATGVATANGVGAAGAAFAALVGWSSSNAGIEMCMVVELLLTSEGTVLGETGVARGRGVPLSASVSGLIIPFARRSSLGGNGGLVAASWSSAMVLLLHI